MNYFRILALLILVTPAVAVAGLSRPQKLAKLQAEDEQAIAERLLMHWNTHATDVFVRDQAVTGVGGERAPVPTVVFCGNRGHVMAYRRPFVAVMDPSGTALSVEFGEKLLKVTHKSGKVDEICL